MSIDRDNIVGFMIRPQVAISSCLMGERVRYDGQHKRSLGVLAAPPFGENDRRSRGRTGGGLN